MATEKWTTVHPIPWRNTSFVYLPWWIYDIIHTMYMNGEDWRDYSDTLYKKEFDTLIEAYAQYTDIDFIESRNGYLYKLSDFTNDPPVPPRPIIDNAPTGTLSKGSGATTLTIVNGGSGYAFGDIITVMGGSPAYSTQVRVTAVDGTGAITGAAVRKAGIYTATPANPVTFDTVGTAGVGATMNLTWNAGAGCSIYAPTTIERTNPAIKYWGSSVSDSTPGFRGNGVGNGTQFRVNFKSNATTIDFRLAGLNSRYDLYVDGKRVSAQSIATDSSGAMHIYTINWGGALTQRSYSLVGYNSAFGGIYIDNTATVTAADDPVNFVWQLGDSYTFGTMATQASFNDFRVMCDGLNVDGLADGIGGSGWTSSGSNAPQNRIQSKLTTLSYPPKYIILSLGYNDAPGGNIPLLQTNFTASYQLIQSTFPAAKVIVIGPATPLGATPQLDAVRTAIMSLCEQYSLTFIDVRNWINENNKDLYTSFDNVHPNDAGYFYRGGRFANELKNIII